VWYQGVARYLLLDADAHTAVLKAEGGEIRGQGNGTALVTVTLSPSPRGTKVQVVTVLSIDGKLAQFAGDALTALSRNRIPEFAENLEFSVLATPKAATAEAVVETHAAEADQASAEWPPGKFAERSADPEPSAPEMGDGQIHPLTAEPEEEQESLIRRLAPYLTVAGFLLIARIVVYSLRRSGR
jgi:hypothetical protein